MLIELGNCLRDKITGFKGIATGYAEYITGCRQWLVTSQTLKPDGDTVANWLDEVRLDVIEGEGIQIDAQLAVGGPPIGPGSAVQSPPTK